MKKLVKTIGEDKKVNGVCGGIGNYLNIDPTIVRLAFTLGFFFYGVGLGTYLLLALVMPKEKPLTTSQAQG